MLKTKNKRLKSEVRGMGNRVWPFIVFAVLLILDQASKYLAYFFSFDNSVLFYVQNPGGTLGMFESASGALLVLSVFAALLLAHVIVSTTYRIDAYLFAVVLAGVVGNGLDRIFLGAVSDFIRFFGLFIFNLADVYITVGVVCLLLLEIPWVRRMV